MCFSLMKKTRFRIHPTNSHGQTNELPCDLGILGSESWGEHFFFPVGRRNVLNVYQMFIKITVDNICSCTEVQNYF